MIRRLTLIRSARDVRSFPRREPDEDLPPRISFGNIPRVGDLLMKIYVGNLSFNTTEAELNELFSQHGEVTEVSVITDRETGRSRGFGFVEMKDDNAARNAISALEGTDLGGRRLTVNEARPRPAGGGGGGGNRGGGGGGRRDRW
jgi:cold-inducible RNA-binding protein